MRDIQIGIVIGILAVLFIWALLHGGTRDKQPTVDMQPIIDVHPTIYYDDEHDVSGLLEED